MAITVATLAAKVTADGVEETERKIEDVGRKADETKGHFEGLKNALSFAAGQVLFTGASAGFNFLKDQLTDIIKLTADHQQIEAQTNQVLKSTHDVSGMTAEALDKLAQAFDKTTEFSADTVKSGEDLLLTFTNIGHQVFPQATQAILDVSQAMGQDLKESAIQVGKALGDPLTGMTALQRIGVTFSKDEKDQIKTMMEHNNIIGAQKVILHELATEFGGSAAAAGKTFGGQMTILKDTLEELKIKIGTALLPVMTQFVGLLTTNAMPLLQRFGDWFIKNGVPALQQLAGEAQKEFLPMLGKIGDWINKTGLPLFQQLGDWFAKIGLPAFRDMASTVENNVLPPLVTLTGQVVQVAGQFGNWLVQSGFLQDAVGTLSGLLGTLVGWVSDLISGMQTGDPWISAVAGGLTSVATAIGLIKIEEFGAGVYNAFQKLQDGAGIVANLASRELPNLSHALGWTKTAMVDVGTAATEAEATTATAAAGMTLTMGVATAGISLAIGGIAALWLATQNEITVSGNKMSQDVQKEYDAMGNSAADNASKAAAKQQEAATDTSNEIKNQGSRVSEYWISSYDKASQAADNAKAKMILDAQQVADATSAAQKEWSDWVNQMWAQGIDVVHGGKVQAPGPTTIPGGHHLPGHASGILNNPIGHFAMVGEQGPEPMFVPQGASILPNSMLSGGSSSGGSNQVLVLTIDGVQFARVAMPYLTNQTRYAVGSIGW
jgi:hypothetical protein